MPRRPATWVLLWFVLAWTTSCATPPPARVAAATPDELPQRLAAAVGTPHPRLMMTAETAAHITDKLAADPGLSPVFEHLRASADATLEAAPVERIQIGRRLLGVSRTVLKRVTTLAFMHRMTDDLRYAARAEQEMVAAAEFTDWNPSHFLDVAEMTAALGLGYDWLFDALSPEGRATIRRGIVDLGLRPSLEGGWWVQTENNWNQVCHGGLTIGALAVLEDEPELAAPIIARALANVPHAAAEYAPDGAYPEGPGYWDYGTSYHVLLIDALRSALGTDFGLADAEGFLASSDYFVHVTAPSGGFFNYSDGGEKRSASPALHWFATEREAPSLLWQERRDLDALLARHAPGADDRDRLLPFLLLWTPALRKAEPPAALHFHADGRTPVAVHRTGWGEGDVFVGIKAGSPGANHGHMDIGSFVLEADGVRWAIDLGSQNYNSLESRGIQLWDRGQKGRRWDVFRIGNLSHSTLVVDGQKQRVAGFAPILESRGDRGTGHTLVDLTGIYAGQLDRALRRVGLTADRTVIVEDDLLGGDRSATVRWGMLTRATVEIVDARTARLASDGKTLTLRVLAPESAQLSVVDTATPRQDFDAPNPGTSMLAFECTVPARAETQITVELVPASANTPATRGDSAGMR